jgi:hypothetical protein
LDARKRLSGEIAGRAGMYFDPDDSESLSQTLYTLCDEKIYYAKSVASIENARKYSWHKAARLHANAYKHVINEA